MENVKSVEKIDKSCKHVQVLRVFSAKHKNSYICLEIIVGVLTADLETLMTADFIKSATQNKSLICYQLCYASWQPGNLATCNLQSTIFNLQSGGLLCVGLATLSAAICNQGTRG